jgi:hypothetical protein
MAAKSAVRKRLEGILGRWALWGAWALFRLMPLRAAQRLGAGLGWLAYALSRRYRRVAIENLRTRLPRLDAPAGQNNCPARVPQLRREPRRVSQSAVDDPAQRSSASSLSSGWSI